MRSIVIVFLVLSAGSAFAQASVTDIQLDPELGQCLADCAEKIEADLLAQLENPNCFAEEGCSAPLEMKAAVVAAAKKIAPKVARKHKLIEGKTRIEDRRYVSEKVQKTIEVKNYDSEIERLDRLIADLDLNIAEDLALLKDEVEALKKQVEVIEHKNGEQDGRLDNLESALRLADFGRTLKVGPEIGFIGLQSLDGTIFTGGLLGVRVSHALMQDVELYVDGGALLSLGEAPLGARGGAGIRWELPLTDLESDRDIAFGVDLGTHGAMVGLNDQLDGKTIFTTVDLGLFGRIDNVELGVVLTGGSEFDQDSPAAAFGAGLVLRAEF